MSTLANLKISVIIATYNREQYIGRAIRSLLNQSLPRSDYEIIVVDDGSTDHTRHILESYGDWIRVISLGEHRGIPFACNEGIRRALGRYVVRVDSDDYVHQDFLMIENLYLSLNLHFSAVACDYFLVNENEEHIAREDADINPIACGIMFRRDNLIAIGLYDEEFSVLEEVDLRFRYLERFNIYHIQLPLYRYRMHGSNITNDKKSIQHYQDVLERKYDSS